MSVRAACIGLALAALCAVSTSAQQAGSGGELRAATQNPISSMYSLPFKFTFDNGADNGDANILTCGPSRAPSSGSPNEVSLARRAPRRLGKGDGVEGSSSMSQSAARFRLGATVLVVSFCAPAFIPLVAASGLPVAWRTALSGLLAAGIPEVGMVAAVAIMGKGGFARFKSLLGRWLAPVAPPHRVGATRYRIGLVLFVLPIALAWAEPYFGHHLPGYDAHPLFYAIGGDVMLLASLFLLGGEFWDKLRALFTQEVRVVPAAAADSGS